MQNLIGLAGIVVILGIAFAFSSNRKAINLRIVGAAFGLQVVIAILVLYWDQGQRAIAAMKNGVMAVIGFSQAGINMVFGPLADTDVIGFSFAINVLPIIIFFSALMSVLYHLRVMEWIVKIVGGALHKIIGTGAVESMNAAANIFVGQTEAPLAVKPYLKGLTEPQMFAVMVSGLASIAGTVLAGYALMGAEIKYLLAAAFMAAPGGLLMAKIIIPDDEKVSSSQHESLEMEKSQHKNFAKSLRVLKTRLYEAKREAEHKKRSDERKSKIGSGDRSQRIRTYNFPQNRLTDHRIGITLHNLPRIMEGEIDELIDALATHERAKHLAGQPV